MHAESRSLHGLRSAALIGAVASQLLLDPGLLSRPAPDRAVVSSVSGQLCADIFFCLSGLVLTTRYGAAMGRRLTTGTVAGYAAARAARLWPVYLVALLATMTVVVVRQLTGGPVPAPEVDTPHLLAQVLLVQTWGATSPVGASWIAASWSVSALVLASALFPFLVLAVSRAALAVSTLGRLVTAVFLPLPVTVLAATDAGTSDVPGLWLLRLVTLFCAGMLMATVAGSGPPRRLSAHAARTPRSRTWAGPLLGTTVAAAAVSLVALRTTDAPAYAVLVLLVAPVVGLVGCDPRWLRPVLGNRLAVEAGRSVYSLLLAWTPVFLTVQALVATGSAGAASTALVPVVAAVATVPIAVLFRRRVEVPAAQMLTRPPLHAAPVDPAPAFTTGTMEGGHVRDQG